jgi:O-antigen/teichoic acid export membrane protein
VLRGTLSNYLGQFVTLVVGFVLTPFIIHAVGAAQYGLWVLVLSVVAYGTLFDFGIWGTVIKYVAEHRARAETEAAHRLVATALTLHTLLGLIVIALSVLLAPVFPRLFNVAPADYETATALVLVAGLSIGVSIPSTTSVAVLRGLHRFDLANVISAAGTLLNGVAVVLVLLAGGGVVAMVAAGIPVTLLMQVPAVWLVYRVAPELKFGWRGAQRRLVRRVISFGSPLFVMQAAGRLQNKTDEIVIGATLTVTAIAPYSVARRLSEWSALLTDQFTKVLMPLASELQADTDWSRLRELYLTGTRLTLAIFLPIGGALVLLARPLLTVWVGPEFADSAPLVAILTLAGLIDASQKPAASVLQGAARHQRLAAMTAISAVANLALSIMLAYRIGVLGVALGTLIPTVLINLGLIMPYARRKIGVSWKMMLTLSVLPALLPMLPAVLVWLVLLQSLALTSWIEIGLAAAGGGVTYAIGYLLIGASATERQTYHLVMLRVARLAATLRKYWRTAS